MPAPAAQKTLDRINEARRLMSQGLTNKARSLLKDSLQADPRSFDAAFLLGMTYAQQGNLKMAVNAFRRATQINSGAVEGHYNLAYALQLQGEDKEGALASYDRALAIEPGYHEALHNRSGVLEDLGRLEEALASVIAALAVRPDAPESLYNRGAVLMKLGRFHEALDYFDKALALVPNHIKALGNRGLIYLSLQRKREALDDFSRVIALNPLDAEAHFRRGAAAMALKLYDLAAKSFQESTRLNPEDASAWIDQGSALDQLKRYEEAIVCFERTRKLDPDARYVEEYVLMARLNLCNWKDYDAQVAHVLEITDRDAFGLRPLSSLFVQSSRAQQKKAAAAVAKIFVPNVEPLPFGERKPGERIRVAYLSADFHLHPVALLTARMFELHDRSRFEIFAFSIGDPSVDWMRKRIETAVDHFLNIRDLGDSDIVALARRHGIDIAIDMTGYTGDTRVGVFTHRAAPVQVNYLGYSATMGVDFIDYIIGDPVLIPHDHAPDYSEKIVRLPACYMPSDPTRKIAKRPFSRADYGLPEAGFVFCAFNNPNKITPAQFDIWMRILHAVDGSVLWLSANHAKAIENLKREAVRRGIDAARLVFAKRENDIADHLGRHRLADLFLDTLPYNAHATCNDALWAGLPVLTRLGESYAARVAGSLVTNVGMADMIASDGADYEARAIEIANTPGRAAELKARLAANLPNAPLFDAVRYTRNIEAAFTAMHERRMAGLAPDHIDVPGD